MQATYNAAELKYDSYQITIVNAVIAFGNPEHMSSFLNVLQDTNITDSENNQLIYRRIESQYQWVTGFAKSRILDLAEEIGSRKRHRQRANDDVNMLLSMIENYAYKFKIDVENKEQLVRSELEQMLDERLPLN